MLRFVTDEHVPAALVRALRAREPGLDIVRNVEVGLRTASDQVILDWAVAEGRAVLTMDWGTMIGSAYERMTSGAPFAGLVVYPKEISNRKLIEDILTVAGVLTPGDLAVEIVYLPL